MKTYDIINAGPRNRFMANGKIVSNSGHGAQLQNLPRGDKAVEKKIDRAIELLHLGDYENAQKEFGDIMSLVSTLVRPAFRAPDGHSFVVCDLGSIENRVLGWVARCPAMLDVFVQGRDPYLSFAVYLYNQPYEELLAEYEAGNKDKRQMAKPGSLGAGFRLGGGNEITDDNGDTKKTGLWAYAETLGVKMTQAEAQRAVDIFREAYPEVVQLWYDLENAAFSVLRHGKPIKVGPLEFSRMGKVLRILLPSGRYLHYLNPKIEEREFYGSQKKTLVYDGIVMQTKQWGRIPTHGGRFCENAIQAIARDILLHGMMKAAAAGFHICAHIHDELVALVKDEDLMYLGLEELRACMVDRPPWAADLPLAAEGWVGQHYKKG